MDGLDPKYLEKSDLPNLRRLMQEGVFRKVSSVIPSVTNVNNASIVTASFPESHGITGNYWYDRQSGREYYMESSDFLLEPTLFEIARRLGYRTALLTAKEKILRLLNKGTDIAVSAQNPPPEWVDRIGKTESIYSAEINYWLMRALQWLLKNQAAELIYVATTDYMMHSYAPEEDPSQKHLHTVDELLGRVLNDCPGLELYLTADHGMNAKTEAIDLGKILAAAKIKAQAIPIIKDKYVRHHSNMGGASYIYLDRSEQVEEALSLLGELRGLDGVFRKDKAVRKFHLHPERIGDIFVLGERHVAFGLLNAEREEIKIRSHGSRFEATVPLLAFGSNNNSVNYHYNLDVVRHLQL